MHPNDRKLFNTQLGLQLHFRNANKYKDVGPIFLTILNLSLCGMLWILSKIKPPPLPITEVQFLNQ